MDYTTVELAVGVAGTVTIGGILMLMLNAVRDFFPGLSGKWAIGAVYFVSYIASMILVASSGPDWSAFLTYVSWFVIGASLTVPTRGMYHIIFQGPAGEEILEANQEDKKTIVVDQEALVMRNFDE